MGKPKTKYVPIEPKPQRFEQLVDGAMFIQPSGEHFSQVCCDCGSAHNIKATVINAEEIEIQLYKNLKLTKEARAEGGQNGMLLAPNVYEAVIVLCKALSNWPKNTKFPKGYRKDMRSLASDLLKMQETFGTAVKSGDFLS